MEAKVVPYADVLLAQQAKVKVDWTHTRKTHEHYITKTAIEWKPNGSRKKGWPKQPWGCCTLEQLEAKNLSWLETKKIVLHWAPYAPLMSEDQRQSFKDPVT